MQGQSHTTAAGYAITTGARLAHWPSTAKLMQAALPALRVLAVAFGFASLAGAGAAGPAPAGLGSAGSTCTDLSRVLRLDEATDSGLAFNEFAASLSQGACIFIPSNATLATSTTLRLTVPRVALNFGPRAKVRLLPNAGAINAILDLAADSTVSNAEIDGNSAHQRQLISGIRTTGSPTVRLTGQTYIHDTTQYGLKAPGAPNIHIERILCARTTYDCVHAENFGDEAAATVAIDHMIADRSAIRPEICAWPSLQVIGTPRHPTLFLLGDADLKQPVDPVSGSCEGMETRFLHGRAAKVSTEAGSIGVSIASGTANFHVERVSATLGPNRIGLEIGSSDGRVPTNHIAIGSALIDGRSASGDARTPRAIALDGRKSGHDVVIDSLHASGFTDDGLTIAATFDDTTSWRNVTVKTGEIDGASVSGSRFKDKNGINLVATNGGVVSGITFGNISVHGGGAAAACVVLSSVTHVKGRIECDGIDARAGKLVRLIANGATLRAMDDIDLTIVDGGKNPTAEPIAMAPLNGGALGSHVNIRTCAGRNCP